jgi:2-iminobutanoate/2-iminopropanoate deaminase
MSEIEIIESPDLPQPAGAYSHAVRVGPLIYVSGQIGLNPKTGKLAGDDIESQTAQVLDNLEAVLRVAGTDFSRVVKVEIYLTDLENFATVNQLYSARLAPFKPARQTMEVSRLPLDVKIEISCIAHM